MDNEEIKDILTTAMGIYAEQCDDDGKYVDKIIKAEEIIIDALNVFNG